MGEEQQPGRSAASVRAAEMATAVAVFLLGALVAGDSYRLGASWGEDGPQAGYFPFYVGLLICLSGAGIFIQALRNAALADDSFVERSRPFSWCWCPRLYISR